MEYAYATDDTLGRRGIFNPLLLAVAIALAEVTKIDPLDLLAASNDVPPFVEDAAFEAAPTYHSEAAYYELSVA
ncbi:hypothetical protein GJW-30_1_02333 [Variibacter gotjawalensis]|uniref:Uncharacterized protein n=1 Tax=Variibacter gotjawalensis TaxID=1333996 RepID=A0A0S3PV39_9BRAD|nr:hypothetical protein [Variibacter gotjawalensis]NIK50126.1 hypothetical protein [Variibacter gotjawalensis]RZS46123.1 hypothetical protein EV661_4453 [Variibacter gotjawalensis]BAT59799.1 hypothetical protein GJW-30_1_02333 [Variibacter gotjawalensis]